MASRRLPSAFALSRTCSVGRTIGATGGSLSVCHYLSTSTGNSGGERKLVYNLFEHRPEYGKTKHKNSPKQKRRRGGHLSSSSSFQGQGSQTQKQTPSSTKLKKFQKKNKKGKPKRPRQLFRADRVLANRSGKTRTECHKLLKKYAVSILEEEEQEDATDTIELDPTKLRVLAAKEQIPMTARIFINKKFEVPLLPPLLTVYHKPKWVLSTMGNDAKERKNLQALKFAFSKQMHPVGRLDYDTSGLLLFSSSGPLTQTLLHPKFEKEKEYVAVVAGTVQEDVLRKRLQTGVVLADIQTRGNTNKSKTRAPADIYQQGNDNNANDRPTFTTRADLLEVQHWPSEQVKPYLNNVLKTLPQEYNVTDLNLRGYMDVFKATELSEVRIVVQEGKHRMVRRMLASCGHPVASLKRERVGVIDLGDLPEGAFRNTTLEEEAWAQSLLVKKK